MKFCESIMVFNGLDMARFIFTASQESCMHLTVLQEVLAVQTAHYINRATIKNLPESS